MSLPAYAEYKDSGVEWLGDVPKHWAIGSLKNLLKIRSGQDYKTIETTDENAIPVIGSGGQFTYATKFIYDGKSILLGRKGTIDKPLYIEGQFWTADTMFYTEISEETDPRYAYWTAVVIPFGFYSTSTALPSMSQFDLSNHAISYPDLIEQTTIARFLDHETAKIDALIAEQQRLIELLKEKRQAVISHAVTKGLDPNAPMKDSGVAWLGDVPEHWTIGAIKYFTNNKKGSIKTGPFGSHLTSSDMQSGEVKVYNQRNVIDNNFESGENFISEEKFKSLKVFEVFSGDILVTTRGTIGRVAILPENTVRGILHPCLLRIQVNESIVIRDFLKGLIQDSSIVSNQLSYLSNSTTIEVIYSEIISSIVIAIPPISEQKKILGFLDEQTAKINELISHAHQGIDLLKERRSALISAAVTGKIDVRGWQPPATAATTPQGQQQILFDGYLID